MVIINCKKCLKEHVMPSRRFKICTNCNPKNKKIKFTSTTIINLEPLNRNRLLDIFYLINEISSYLTIYELYSFYQTCKEFKNILHLSQLWYYMYLRDFKIPVEIDSFKFAIALDSGIICNICLSNECNYRRCVYSKNISKTICLEYYRLTEKELNEISSNVKYNNFYRKYITMFNHREIKDFVVKKYFGFTNFLIYRNKLDNIKRERKKKREENRIKKEKEFLKWKEDYKNSFDYSKMSNNERENLLNLEFQKNSMIRRRDSRLCKEFIRGNVNDKSIEHIIAILKLTFILFTYNHIIYTIYNEECNLHLEKVMFNNRKKNNYTWLNAVEDTHNTYRNRFNSIIIF